MKAFTIVLLFWTAAMLGLHLASRPILRRVLGRGVAWPSWLSAKSVVRFEGLYYVALVTLWWEQRTGWLAGGPRADWAVLALALMAVIHLGGWAFAEVRRAGLAAAAQPPGPPSEARLERILLGIQIFDLAESAVLLYIGWRLALVLI